MNDHFVKSINDLGETVYGSKIAGEFGMKLANKNKYLNCAELIRYVSQNMGDERGAKCGYDLMIGLNKGDMSDRFFSWKTRLVEVEQGETSFTDAERDGVWVPAIPLKIGDVK